MRLKQEIVYNQNLLSSEKVSKSFFRLLLKKGNNLLITSSISSCDIRSKLLRWYFSQERFTYRFDEKLLNRKILDTINSKAMDTRWESWVASFFVCLHAYFLERISNTYTNYTYMKRLLHKYSNHKKITKKSQATFEIKVPTMFLNTW